MSLVGTLAKVALGVAAVKGAGYVASQRWRQGKFRQHRRPSRTERCAGERRWCPTRNWRPANLVLGGKGQAGGGLGGLLEQLAAAASAGSTPGATAPASGGGLDALIRSLGDAVTHPGTTNKADAGGSLRKCPTRPSKNWANPRSHPRHNRMLRRA